MPSVPLEDEHTESCLEYTELTEGQPSKRSAGDSAGCTHHPGKPRLGRTRARLTPTSTEGSKTRLPDRVPDLLDFVAHVVEVAMFARSGSQPHRGIGTSGRVPVLL